MTRAANSGSVVDKKYAMMPFSSRGPREDGGFTPTLSAPGAAINTTQTWLPGSPVAEAGYPLPAGYSMLQGTSMASPQATGAINLSGTNGTVALISSTTLLTCRTAADCAADATVHDLVGYGTAVIHERSADAPAASNTTSLVQRFLEPSELASLITYLASPLASATNGGALRADGGRLVQVL